MLNDNQLNAAVTALNNLITYHKQEIVPFFTTEFTIGTSLLPTGIIERKSGEPGFPIAKFAVKTGKLTAHDILISCPAGTPLEAMPHHLEAQFNNFKNSSPLITDFISVGVSVIHNFSERTQPKGINFIFEIKDEAQILALPERVNALLATKPVPTSTTPFAGAAVHSPSAHQPNKKRDSECTIS